jgi:ubiquitin C-terminal hydrolase
MQNYCENNNILELLTIPSEKRNFILAAAHKSLERYNDKNNIYNIRSQNILDMLSDYDFDEKNCNIGLFKNIGNSCYMDSILLPLLLPTILNYNNFIYNQILNSDTNNDCSKNIQILLNKMVSGIKSGQILKVQKKSEKKITCINFREILEKVCKQYIDEQTIFYGSDMQDSGEFLDFMLRRFNTDLAVRKRNTKYINTKTKKQEIAPDIYNSNSSISVSIPYGTIFNIKNSVNIKDFLEEKTEAVISNPSYDKAEITEKLIDTPFIIFNVSRKIPSIKTAAFLKTPIIPTKFLTLDSGKKFYLYAITVYQALHYTCYLLCGNNWYYYNDLGPSFKKIGSFEDLLISKPSPITQGTQYFYNIL